MTLALTVFETAWNSTTKPKTLAVTGCLTGDQLFVIAGSGHTGGVSVTALTTTTTVGSTGAWTEPRENLNSPSSEAWISSAVAQVTADGDVTVQVAITSTASPMWGFAVVRARDSAGLGVSGFVDVSATQVVSLAVAAGSAVFFGSFDWDAGSVGTGWTPTADVTLIERSIPSSNYTVHSAYWVNQAAGTRNYGSTGAGGSSRKSVALEILAGTAVTGTAAAIGPAHTAAAAGSGYVTGSSAGVGPAHTAAATGQVGSILKQNTGENGLANNTDLTTANSDDDTAGDAFNVVTPGASNTIRAVTSPVWMGTRSIAFAKASTNQCFVGWTWSGAQATFVFRMGFRFPAGNLAASEPVIRLFSGAAYTPQIGAVLLEAGSGRKLRVSDTGTATNVDSTASLAQATDYLLEARWVSGVSLTANVYAKGSGALVATATVTASSGSVNSVRIGLTGSGNSAVTLVTDDLAIGHTDWLARTDVVVGTVAATGPAHTVTAAGTDSTPGVTGTGAAVGPQPTVAATGQSHITGTSTPTGPQPTTAAAGQASVTGSSVAIGPTHTAAGAASAVSSGAGAATGPTPTGAGSGSVAVGGAVAASGPPPTFAGSGSTSIQGSGSATGPSHTSTAVGQLRVDGAAAGSGPSATGAGSGQLKVTGSGAVAGPAHTALVGGQVGEDAVGGLAAVGPQPAAAAAGTLSVTGSGTASGPQPLGAAIAAALITGAVSGFGPAHEVAGTGGLSLVGDLVAVGPAHRAAIIGLSGLPADITVTVGPLPPPRWAGRLGESRLVGSGLGPQRWTGDLTP